jgi:hypothetical protein
VTQKSEGDFHQASSKFPLLLLIINNIHRDSCRD